MTPEDNFEEKKENGLKKKRPRVGDANPISSSFYQPRTNYDNRGTDNHPYQQRSYSNNRSNDNYQNRDNYRSQDNYRGGDNYRNRDQNQNRNNIYQNRQSGGNYGNSNYQNRSNNYQNRDNNYQNRQGGGNYGNNSYQNRNNDNRGQYRPNNDQNNRQGGYNQRPYNNHQQQQRPYNKQRPYNNQQQQQRQRPVVTPVKYKENVDPDTEIRLNKYLANAGVCSRREADAFIQAGVVKVNGAVITELGTKVKRSDEVFFHEQPVRIESKVYVLLNKPKNCVTTSDDPQNRMTVMDLVKNACPERIYPVGRLDRITTGVLVLTNYGDLASNLMHPIFLKK
jgi:23S rRNA pseudouridine2605 synthase